MQQQRFIMYGVCHNVVQGDYQAANSTCLNKQSEQAEFSCTAQPAGALLPMVFCSRFSTYYNLMWPNRGAAPADSVLASREHLDTKQPLSMRHRSNRPLSVCVILLSMHHHMTPSKAQDLPKPTIATHTTTTDTPTPAVPGPWPAELTGKTCKFY
jgi:hypothetical protein